MIKIKWMIKIIKKLNITTFNLKNNSCIFWCKHYLTSEFSQILFNELLNTLSFEHSIITIYGEKTFIPRLQSWMADENITNKQASLFQKQPSKPWSPHILMIKLHLESLFKCKFHYVLINYYRDGKDYIGFHADNEASDSKYNVIASITLGETRTFLVRHKTVLLKRKKQIDENNNLKNKTLNYEFDLSDGSLIVMCKETQKYWKHSIPKSKTNKARINLTFRQC